MRLRKAESQLYNVLEGTETISPSESPCALLQQTRQKVYAKTSTQKQRRTQVECFEYQCDNTSKVERAQARYETINNSLLWNRRENSMQQEVESPRTEPTSGGCVVICHGGWSTRRDDWRTFACWARRILQSEDNLRAVFLSRLPMYLGYPGDAFELSSWLRDR